MPRKSPQPDAQTSGSVTQPTRVARPPRQHAPSDRQVSAYHGSESASGKKRPGGFCFAVFILSGRAALTCRACVGSVTEIRSKPPSLQGGSSNVVSPFSPISPLFPFSKLYLFIYFRGTVSCFTSGTFQPLCVGGPSAGPKRQINREDKHVPIRSWRATRRTSKRSVLSAPLLSASLLYGAAGRDSPDIDRSISRNN